MLKVGIVGAGRGGTALINLFAANGEVEVAGITDRDAKAPALDLARGQGIFVAGNINELLSLEPDIVINATGDPGVTDTVREAARHQVEVIEGKGARFLCEMVERGRQTARDMEVLYKSGVQITRAKGLEAALDEVLSCAMELVGTPAGSIALLENREMVMVSHKGLSRDFFSESRWSPRGNGLTKTVLDAKRPVAFPDAAAEPLLKDTKIVSEGIRALLACPLLINGGVVGILYLDDFAPREFTERHKYLVKMFSQLAAHAIEKFRIVSELRMTVEELDTATSYMNAVFEDSGDMIATTDREGNIVRFSSGGERILGYREHEVTGMPAASFYTDSAEREAIISELKKKGIVTNHETVLRRKDGTPVDISLTISLLRDRLGKVMGTVGISKDITKEKTLRRKLNEKNAELTELNEKLEEKVLERTRELERANRELTRANQAKSRFISNMSHELRTPLYSVLGFSEILLDKTFGELNDRQDKYLLGIQTSGKHLLQLVNNILDLAKIEAGKIELAPENLALPEVLDEVMAIMKSLSDRKSITLSNEADPEIGEFACDRVKVKQILYNLLSNAIKFTPEGGKVAVEASLIENKGDSCPWAMPGQKLVRVSVTDTGIGIREEDMERIFDEFEQADSTFSREFGGTGLGLSLTRRLVELHGGHIEARSVHGGGSTFTVYLPYARLDTEAKEAEHVEREAGELVFASREAPEVLLIEDDHATSEILTLHLSRAGYRVSHAFDGLEGLRKAVEQKPFAIILDVMLPKLDGWEVLQRLKSDPETSRIPVVIHSIVDNKELAFALGATDYILKPIDKEVFLSRLRDISLPSRRDRYPAAIMLMSKDPETIESFNSILADSGILLHAITDPAEAGDMISTALPDALIVDADDQEATRETMEEVRRNRASKGLPVFLCTARELSMNERLLFAGRVDHVIRKDSTSIPELIRHLREMEVLFPKGAGLIDDLTGVFNHRYLQLRLAQETQRWARYKSPLSFILIDMDGFGGYIQKNGPYYGNMVLRKTAEIIRKNIRGTDVLARYGGDEFGLILPNTTSSAAQNLGRRFVSLIRDYPFLHEETQPKGRITASIGVSDYRGESPENLIRNASDALESAKQEGGDRIKSSVIRAQS